MVKFRFFVHCDGWKDGGYENTHFAETKKEAVERVAEWNKQSAKRNDGCFTSLISIEEISMSEFAEDYVGEF